jgi:hypothetical protein
MKNMDEFARHLAALYGIEVIEKPNCHRLTLENGAVLSSEHPDFFGKAFGILPSVPECLYQKTAQFKAVSRPRAQRNGFSQFYTPKQPVSVQQPVDAGNYNYAMAA